MQARGTGCIIVGCLLAGWLANVAAGQSVLPWKVGDTWQVGVWQGQAVIGMNASAATSQAAYNPRGRMIAVTFRVVAIAHVDTTKCFRVDMTFPPEGTGFQRRYQVYYATQTGRLLRITDVSLTPSGAARGSVTDLAGASAGPTAVMDVASLVPLDWPDWTRADVPAPTRAVRPTSQASVPAVALVEQTAGETEITLTTQVGQKVGKVVQTWDKGRPWWTGAKKYDGEDLMAEALLLEVNGQKVASGSNGSNE